MSDDPKKKRRRRKRKGAMFGSAPMRNARFSEEEDEGEFIESNGHRGRKPCPSEYYSDDDYTSGSTTSGTSEEDTDDTTTDEDEPYVCPPRDPSRGGMHGKDCYTEPLVPEPDCPYRMKQRIGSGMKTATAPPSVSLREAVSHIGSRAVATLEPQSLVECAQRAFTEEFGVVPELEGDASAIGSNMHYDRQTSIVTIRYTYKFVFAPKNVKPRTCRRYRKNDMAVVLEVPKQVLFLAALKHMMELHGDEPMRKGLWAEMHRRAKSCGFRHKAAPKVLYQYSSFPYHLTVQLPGTTRMTRMGASHCYDLLLDPYNYSCRTLVKVPLAKKALSHEDDEVAFLKSISNEALDKVIRPSAAHDDQMYYLHFHSPVGLQIREYAVDKDLGGQAWNLSQRENVTSEESVRMYPKDAMLLRQAFEERRASCITPGSLPLVLNAVMQDDADDHCPSAWYKKGNERAMFHEDRKFAMTVEYKIMMFV